MTNAKRDVVKYCLIGLSGLSIFFAGWFTQQFFQAPVDSSVPQRLHGYKYISPLIACDVASNQQALELQPFKKIIQKTVSDHIKSGDITQAGVYVRELNSGHWVGYNENSSFWPASLMKVPAMISVLKKIEESPEILKSKISYKNNFDENNREHFKSTEVAQAGRAYSVEELLGFMIRNSDNNSVIMLAQFFSKDQMTDVFYDTGVKLPNEEGQTEDYMSVKTYSYFFRLLFNASYLDRHLSEYALNLLSQTDFKEGIARGVPATIDVAHKFGEVDRGSEKQLHDCGIIYFPNHPYLLCVMTRASDFEGAKKTIGDISSAVYGQAREVFKN